MRDRVEAELAVANGPAWPGRKPADFLAVLRPLSASSLPAAARVRDERGRGFRTHAACRSAHTQMDPGFEIVGLAALGAATSEFISWLLIYRKEEYQRLSASIANAVRLLPPLVLCRAPNATTLWLSSRAARRRPLGTPHSCRAAEARALCPPAQSKRLEKEKEVPVKGGAKNKNLVRIEKELARENRDMAFHRMKSSVAAGILHALVFSYIYHKYDGQPVARLPFEPFTFIRQISHRNLPGNDYRECSVVFFYMLCSLCLRPLLQRAHGFAPSNNPSLMVRPPDPPYRDAA